LIKDYLLLFSQSRATKWTGLDQGLFALQLTVMRVNKVVTTDREQQGFRV
jgi:hypothetical protein